MDGSTQARSKCNTRLGLTRENKPYQPVRNSALNRSYRTLYGASNPPLHILNTTDGTTAYATNRMIQNLKATYADGVFKPAERVDLDEGAQVIISVSDENDDASDINGLASSAGGWKDTIDCDQLLRDIYDSRAKMPHYISPPATAR